MEIYKSGNFSEAKLAFETVAAIGERSSLFNFGVMYYRGEGVEKDSIRAYALMKIANDGHDDESFTKVINALFNSFDSAQKEEAGELFSKLDATYNIAKIRNNVFPKPLNDEDCLPELTPIKRERPVYPSTEQRKGRMGVTHTQFTVSPEGYHRDLVILSSTSKAFTKSTVKAIKKHLYEPAVNGKPIYEHRLNLVFQFSRINGEDPRLKTSSIERKLDTLKKNATDGDVVAQYQYGKGLNMFRSFKSYLEKIDLQYKTANEWYRRSAAGGLPHAQYEIGRNMIEGRGCEVDIINGYKWINAAAYAGYSPAQRTLAQSVLSRINADVELDKSAAVIGWLRNASQSDDFAAKLLLAWELSTSKFEQFRNSKEALMLLKAKSNNYFDEIRLLETQAAAYANIGDFKKAIKTQIKAQKIARKRNWIIPLISERLALYEHNEPYRGTYY